MQYNDRFLKAIIKPKPWILFRLGQESCNFAPWNERAIDQISQKTNVIVSFGWYSRTRPTMSQCPHNVADIWPLSGRTVHKACNEFSISSRIAMYISFQPILGTVLEGNEIESFWPFVNSRLLDRFLYTVGSRARKSILEVMHLDVKEVFCFTSSFISNSAKNSFISVKVSNISSKYDNLVSEYNKTMLVL